MIYSVISYKNHDYITHLNCFVYRLIVGVLCLLSRHDICRAYRVTHFTHSFILSCHSIILLSDLFWLSFHSLSPSNIDIFNSYLDYRSCAWPFYNLVQIFPRALHSNKAVGTIWRDLSKPPQRIQGPDPRPLLLLVGTPLVLRPELTSRRAEHSHSGGCLYIFLICCFFYHLTCLFSIFIASTS